jgi:hypothetical protein
MEDSGCAILGIFAAEVAFLRASAAKRGFPGLLDQVFVNAILDIGEGRIDILIHVE